MKAYYFGCEDHPGHYWFDVGLLHIGDEKFLPMVDGVFAPGDSDKEGVAQLVYMQFRQYRGTYTLLSFWDRSVDERGGCNSNFLLQGILSFDEAVAQSKLLFPSIWKRFTFDVIQWRPVVV